MRRLLRRGRAAHDHVLVWHEDVPREGEFLEFRDVREARRYLETFFREWLSDSLVRECVACHRWGPVHHQLGREETLQGLAWLLASRRVRLARRRRPRYAPWPIEVEQLPTEAPAPTARPKPAPAAKAPPDMSTQIETLVAAAVAGVPFCEDCAKAAAKKAVATHWVEIGLVGEDDEPIPNEEYLITTPDGVEHRGKLDASGKARVDGVATDGQCKVTFPGRDAEAWE